MKTSTKILFGFMFIGWVAMAYGFVFFAIGFIILQAIVLVYAKELDVISPKDKSWIVVTNKYEVLRQKVEAYAEFNDAQILQSETARFIKIFTDHFKQDNVDEHMKITVHTSLTNRDEIVCKAEAVSEKGLNSIKLFNTTFAPAVKALEIKDK